jgi:hypothetical protein
VKIKLYASLGVGVIAGSVMAFAADGQHPWWLGYAIGGALGLFIEWLATASIGEGGR